MLLVSFSFKGSPSGKRDSDPRPQPWQGCALPTELFPQICRNFRFGTANIKGKIHSAKIFRGKFRVPPPKACSEPSGRQMPRLTAAGPRQKPTPRPLPARPSSGPKCRDRDPRRNSRRNAQTIRSPEGEIIRPIGPEPRLHFQAVSGQRAPSPDNRPERPSSPVPNDGFSECHQTGTPRPSARPNQTPGKRGRPPRRSGFRPGTKSYGKRRSPGPAERPVPNRLRTHPECLLEKQTPPAAGPEVSRIYPGIGLPPKPGPDQRTLNPSSARTGMGRLA